ncbi:uncharacterized protein LOC118505489 [Anopheles stephensi]|uniref:uncharacterized protein LOC118505489 n=1 Tax=Anopheles stephensi TaxID=30069 RepID=UPI001658B288|nr:uncharacterized protein LOC118505489 [Anopheles stephensi]XP_035897232.1 uncharacterized protein LOC118505489 [Anopheles stephensi]XP_035897233.1 uncharacterized protein LOC118505489 [Anopheles stephensi]XP_035897234.1 uncharacterized protein LOC118505489 [Anopheles stephensi]XP_035897235.1 uncharacterized protein LOC118505489 [Anopheles stephensi]
MSFRAISSPVVRRLLEANNRKVMQHRFASTHNYASDLRGFTMADMKKNPAVIPLVLIMTTAVVGCTGFILYSSGTRTDVSLNKKVFPFDTMDAMHPQKKKIFVFNQKYEPNPELKEALSYREEYQKLADK